MDRLVFVVVTLALFVATQAQADVWFDEKCVENQSIIASVQNAETRAVSERDIQMAARNVRNQRTGAVKPGPDWLFNILSTFQVPAALPVKVEGKKP